MSKLLGDRLLVSVIFLLSLFHFTVLIYLSSFNRKTKSSLAIIVIYNFVLI